MKNSYTSMLKYKRKQGTDSQKDFCIKFLHPVFGKPDRDGNYIKTIGDKPNVCFAAHHDTVHNNDGMQKVQIIDGVVSLDPASNSSCLGADCTTGIWLILEMIDAKVPGVYVIHSGEEIGCVGSKALVKRSPRWLGHIDAVISFDRKGDNEIITHQMGYRTASDDFANSLADALQLPLEPSDGGSYTDSNEYASIISECTNLAVGYRNQHTKNETQDLHFMYTLRDALVTADWSRLVFSRDPATVEYAYDNSWRYPLCGGLYPSFTTTEEELVAEDIGLDILGIVKENPVAVANLLIDLYGNQYDLIDDLYEHGLDDLSPKLYYN